MGSREYTDKDFNVIIKYWGKDGSCPKNKDGWDGHHWAYYVCRDENERQYWKSEHVDEKNKMYWRHYEFMSIPCVHCGAYSPLRCAQQSSSNFSGEYTNETCKPEQIKNYHPDDSELPDILRTYSENGWFYIYFKETLSDSLDGQETFVLKQDPELVVSPGLDINWSQTEEVWGSAKS